MFSRRNNRLCIWRVKYTVVPGFHFSVLVLPIFNELATIVLNVHEAAQTQASFIPTLTPTHVQPFEWHQWHSNSNREVENIARGHMVVATIWLHQIQFENRTPRWWWWWLLYNKTNVQLNLLLYIHKFFFSFFFFTSSRILLLFSECVFLFLFSLFRFLLASLFLSFTFVERVYLGWMLTVCTICPCTQNQWMERNQRLETVAAVIFFLVNGIVCVHGLWILLVCPLKSWKRYSFSSVWHKCCYYFAILSAGPPAWNVEPILVLWIIENCACYCLIRWRNMVCSRWTHRYKWLRQTQKWFHKRRWNESPGNERKSERSHFKWQTKWNVM